VGLLATIVARTLGAKNLFAIDSNVSRLQTAKRHGAKALNLNSDPRKTILAATENRGADLVIEAVGHGDALRSGYESPYDVLLMIDSICCVLSAL
jgi:threonine dehydrogenase-like Zn-dependent dehydrogenase